MSSTIRAMRKEDKPCLLEMMRVFYASPAVLSNGSEDIFSNDIDNCVNPNPYLDGYVVEDEDGIQGYTMVAKSYSTEFGKPCIWVEDLYIREPYRGMGLGKQLLDFVAGQYTDCIFRLEVEAENDKAIRLYQKCGFDILPYIEMKK